MRKSELIALLNDPDLPDIEVVLSSDEEGNTFNILYEVAYYPVDTDGDNVPFALDDLGLDTAIVLWP